MRVNLNRIVLAMEARDRYYAPPKPPEDLPSVKELFRRNAKKP